MSQILTVGDLVAALQQMPQDLPVLAGCHYDNDDGLNDRVSVDLQDVSLCEAYAGTNYYTWGDPANPGTFKAVTVT